MLHDRFYHLYLKPDDGVTESEVKAALKFAKDFFQYTKDCWIICFGADPARLNARFRKLASENGCYLLAPILMRGKSQMSKSFWTWVITTKLRGKDRRLAKAKLSN